MEAVLKVLYHLVDRRWDLPAPREPVVGIAGDKLLLEKHTRELLGPAPASRSVRIMVTMPSEAADDYLLVHELLAAGMDCVRINCAHDGPDAWARMIANLRRAEQAVGKKCRVLMDLAGPKLRTGPISPGPPVIKWRPQRDEFGRVVAPAHVWLTPIGSQAAPPVPVDACLPVPTDWLANLSVGDGVDFKDTRGKSRSLRIVNVVGDGRLAESTQTSYVSTGVSLYRGRTGGVGGEFACSDEARVGELPARQRFILLRKGDPLILTRDLLPGEPAVYDQGGTVLGPARIGCTLPEVFSDVRPGERIWLDDGKIGGVIQSVENDQILIQISQARECGDKLRADKGINLPDSELRLLPLTQKDIEDLPFIVANADLVGQSFVRDATDIYKLEAELARLGGGHIGIVLKIETRRAFEQLPNLLLASMRSPCDGVMIARGDLAVECGYERLAEVQEEILWICEAAHIPVIWATQVLENLAKEGFPSRAEITDAAMAHRAECVMLNKGPHIMAAARVLDDILRRIQAHQSKKRSMMSKLQLARCFRSD